MMRKVLIIAGFILPFSFCHAQKAPGLPEVENLQDFYRTGIGLRVGWPIAAVTIKHFVTKRTALEVIGAPRWGGGSLTALLEFHRPTRRDGCYWYYGVGVDAGIFETEHFDGYEGNRSESNTTSVGLNAIVGIEKNIHETPFSIGIDVKPRIGVYNPGSSYVEGAISLKYIWGW